ncbi:MAG TPA: hypothetical protein PK629_11615 [Oscillospiraceae bacterium]|nr:hypothetical protein [Oscillospiraceae bacterium]HPF55999.1 hypothetical protein [Clostridiales bacterium]HPK36339.1 hypothetical protein [Oscillospiraceae bacterium]HPR76112.1 hypothetical protein [Oscillospiraceae bacterium]
MRRTVCLIVILLCFGFYGCSGNQSETELLSVLSEESKSSVITVSESSEIASSEPEEPLSAERAKANLQEFLNADSLHLKCLVTYAVYDNTPADAKSFEIWKLGNQFRSDEYDGGSIKFRVIADEQQALQYSFSKNTSYEPIMPPAYYSDFYNWDFNGADSGTVSADGEYVIFTIDNIDQFYKKDTAQAGYYYTEIEFGVNNDSVIYVTLYGNSSYSERPQAVNAVTQTYSFVGLNENFDETVFAAPF